MSHNDTLYTKAHKSATDNSRKTAIVFYGRRITYGELIEDIDAFAAGLSAMGVRAGDVISICLPNTPSAVIAFYAVNKLGAIINLIHPYSTLFELNRTMQSVGSKVLIVYDVFIGNNQQHLREDIEIICSDNNEFMGLASKLYYKAAISPKIKIRTTKFFDVIRMGQASARSIEPFAFDDQSPAVFLPSGGTTGESKIIMHNCRVFNDLAAKAQHFLSGDIRKYRSMYSVLPVFHGFGLCMNMHLCMLQGVINVMCIKFNPSHMAKAIKKERVAVLTGVPAMFIKLLSDKDFIGADLSSLRDCFVGGDVAPQSMIDSFNELLKNQGSDASLYVGYGLTETVTVCGVTSKQHYKPQSIGYPLPDTKFAIIKDGKFLAPYEVGEICICTPIMMLGYYQSKVSPFRTINGERWLFTGDYGYLDEDGYLYFKQRIKNMIKVNGVPVYPSEIESALEKVEGVRRIVAIGQKDEAKGEVVKLIIEPEPGKDTSIIQNNITELATKELAIYSRPRIIEFRDSLPINAIGKIDRTKL